MATGNDFDFDIDSLDLPEELFGVQKVEISISSGGDTMGWDVKSPRVSELLKTTLKSRETNHIENCLEVGDRVLHNASVHTSEETVEKFSAV